MTPREVLRTMKITRSGCWSDVSLLCDLAAEGIERAADEASIWLRIAGSICYRRAVEAKAHADSVRRERDRERVAAGVWEINAEPREASG